jgi:hypothetical protein
VDHIDDTWGEIDLSNSLVGRKAGQGAADKARELRRAHPFASVASRVLGVHTDERAWSKGASGERWAGFFLDRLPAPWKTFHDIPIGERGANVDHIVVGPAGVFTVNTKNVSGKVWLAPRAILVNGHRTDYLQKAISGSRRVAKLLTAADGRAVQVQAALAIFADEWTVKGKPVDVIVNTPRGLAKHLRQMTHTISTADINRVAALIVKPDTWSCTPPPSPPADGCACGGVMLVRTRRSDGARFLGCSNFPKCRRTRPID